MTQAMPAHFGRRWVSWGGSTCTHKGNTSEQWMVKHSQVPVVVHLSTDQYQRSMSKRATQSVWKFESCVRLSWLTSFLNLRRYKDIWSSYSVYSPDFLGRTEVPVAKIRTEQESKGPTTRRLLLHEVPTGEVWVRFDLQLFEQKTLLWGPGEASTRGAAHKAGSKEWKTIFSWGRGASHGFIHHKATRWDCMLLHTKLLAIYANMISPINRRHSTVPCISVNMFGCVRCQGFHCQGYKSIMWKWGIRPPDVTTWRMCPLWSWWCWNHSTHVTSAGSQHSGGEGLGWSAAAWGLCSLILK